MTALDVSETCHRDFKYLKIQDILKAAGVRRSNDLSSPLLPASHDEEAQSAQPIIEEQPALSRFRKWWRYFYLCRWVKHLRRHDNWIDETRGTLMLVATVTATVTFQAGINPPGGVWQDSKNDTVTAGTSIFQSQDSDHKLPYQYFLYSNTISFVAAISVLLVLISGFPLRNKFSIRLLTLTMFIAISAMTLTYFYALFLLNPTTYFGEDYFQYIFIAVLMAAVATIIATVTFQIGSNPLGGVWQDDRKYNNRNCTTGTTMFSDINLDAYKVLSYVNTTSFVPALSVVFLVTIGILKKSKHFEWLLALAMLIYCNHVHANHLFFGCAFGDLGCCYRKINWTSVSLVFGIWMVVLLIAW
ncbi:hypothetical protein I3843_03G107000 [Carya illinoinensis]|nr:hypothetical protein I3843_03G107000 [Carya illinoinensis]